MTRTPLLPLTLGLLAACGANPTPPDPGFDPGVVLHLDPALPVAVLLGGTFEVRVSARSRSGTPISTEGVQFRATDPAVVAVSGAGLVTTVGMGQAYVVAQLSTSYGVVAESRSVSVLCTQELTQAFDPPSKTLTVGEAFAPQATLSTCGGQIRLTDSITWRAVDTLIVSIDSAGLIVTGRSPGATHVRAVSSRLGLLGGIPVTVAP